MSKDPHDRMKDPYYGILMSVIEKEIVKADTEAKELSRPFTDSQVRSALIKAMKIAEGGRPTLPTGSDHDRLLAELSQRILRKRSDIFMQEVDEDGEAFEDAPAHPDRPVPLSHWILAMESVVASIKIRTQMAPGSRGYLEFVHKFVAKMSAAGTEG